MHSDIGVAGVKVVVKETKIAPRYLFITPPDLAELEQRIRGRDCGRRHFERKFKECHC